MALVLHGTEVLTQTIKDFMSGDERRPLTFITNFGDWQLPAPASEALHSSVAHLEWFHDTGELIAIGEIPHVGQGSYEVTEAQGRALNLSGAIGGAMGYAARCEDGAVREFFPSMVVSEDTMIAVLATISHGPRVHEVLWGWHREHRHPDGWAWLEQRLLDA